MSFPKILIKIIICLLSINSISSCEQPIYDTEPGYQDSLQPIPTTDTIEESNSPASPTEAVPTQYNDLSYGVVYPYNSSVWSESDRPKIQERLEYLKTLGVDTVIQTFSSNGTSESWLIFLDEAELLDIQVIAFLYPAGKWTGSRFDYESIRDFLAVVGDHPALLAYLGLHEPLEEFTSEQLKEFYQTVKSYSPDLPIAHYLSDMEWFDGSFRFSGRKFSEGICDICIIWYYPARFKRGNPIFEEKVLIEVIQNNRQLLDNRAPDAQLWFLGQAFALEAHVRNLRMPNPEEMEKIFILAADAEIDGFLWYPWSHGSYDMVLGDEQMEFQRQQVGEIYQKYLENASE